MPDRHNFGKVGPKAKQVKIPNRDEHPWRYRYAVVRWRLALVTVTHTVSLALVIALLIASVPVWLVLAQSKRTSHLTELIQTSRVAQTRVFCTKMQQNTRAVNNANAYLQGLIVQGAAQSKAFDDLLRSRGLPPYRVRVRLAKEQAAKLGSYAVAPLDCGRFVRETVRAAHGQ